MPDSNKALNYAIRSSINGVVVVLSITYSDSLRVKYQEGFLLGGFLRVPLHS